MEILNPLLSYTNIKNAKISAIQIGNRKYLKFGRPRWETDSLKPILESHHSFKENFSFTCLQAEFPSIVSAYKKDETVDIYLSAENDDCWGKIVSDGTCGLFLSLREDIYEKAGEALVTDVLCKIRALFDEVKVLFRKRTWWMYDSVDTIGDATVSKQSKMKKPLCKMSLQVGRKISYTQSIMRIGKKFNLNNY